VTASARRARRCLSIVQGKEVLLLWASTTEPSTEIIVVLEESGRGKTKPQCLEATKRRDMAKQIKKVCPPEKELNYE
jgi:hypothetical protein